METTSTAPRGQSSPLQNILSNQDGSGVTHDSGDARVNSSLLWLPYFFLTLVLVTMAAGSFIKYHHRNKSKYRGKRYLSTNPEIYHKYRVTMNKDGTMPSPFNPFKVIATLPRSNTPDLTRSNRWHHWPPSFHPRYEKGGKFENAGYFLDKLAERRKSRPFSYFNPGFVRSSPQIPNQSSFDENPTSTGSSGSQFQQNSSVRDFSDSSGTEIELLQLQRTMTPPLPPRRNRHNINRYKEYQYQQQQQQQQHQQHHHHGEIDSDYYSNKNGDDLNGKNHFQGNNLGCKPQYSVNGMNNNKNESGSNGNYTGHTNMQSNQILNNDVRGNYAHSNHGYKDPKCGDHPLNFTTTKPHLSSRETLTENRSKITLGYHGNMHSNNRYNPVTMDANHYRDREPLELTAENLILAHQHSLATRDRQDAGQNTCHHRNHCKYFIRFLDKNLYNYKIN